MYNGIKIGIENGFMEFLNEMIYGDGMVVVNETELTNVSSIVNKVKSGQIAEAYEINYDCWMFKENDEMVMVESF